MSTSEEGHLTDEEMKHTLSCFCDKCGTELRIHPLYPLVGPKSLVHACVAKRPVRFVKTDVVLRPMEMPKSLLIDEDIEILRNGGTLPHAVLHLHRRKET